MEDLIRSVLENKSVLTKYYIQERLEKGEGILMILKRTPTEDAANQFIPLTQLPQELLDEYTERKMENGDNPSVIFFYLCTLTEASMMAFNLDDRDWM